MRKFIAWLMFSDFLLMLLAIGFVVVAISFAGKFADKSEIVECLNWKVQAEEFPAFYLTGWQSDQCNAHGIFINAEVIK